MAQPMKAPCTAPNAKKNSPARNSGVIALSPRDCTIYQNGIGRDNPDIERHRETPIIEVSQPLQIGISSPQELNDRNRRHLEPLVLPAGDCRRTIPIDIGLRSHLCTVMVTHLETIFASGHRLRGPPYEYIDAIQLLAVFRFDGHHVNHLALDVPSSILLLLLLFTHDCPLLFTLSGLLRRLTAMETACASMRHPVE